MKSNYRKGKILRTPCRNGCSTTVFLKGTRSENAEIKIDIEMVIFGNIDYEMKITRYTNNGDPILNKNKKYIETISAIKKVSPNWWLEGYVEVETNNIEESIKAHEKKIIELNHNLSK